MVTLEELRKKPVVLEVRLEGNASSLKHLVSSPEIHKLEYMSIKEAVKYVLSFPYNESEELIKKDMIEYIENYKKRYNGEDVYCVHTPVGGVFCSWSRNTIKIEYDERETAKITDYIVSAKTKDQQDIWLGKLILSQPRML